MHRPHVNFKEKKKDSIIKGEKNKSRSYENSFKRKNDSTVKERKKRNRSLHPAV